MTKDEALTLALEALKQIDEAMPFPVAKLAQAAIKEALAQPDAFEQGRQEGMKQERALWELSRLGQEIEAQPEQELKQVAHVYLLDAKGWPKVGWDDGRGIKVGDKLYTLNSAEKLLAELISEPENTSIPWPDEERNFCPRCGKRLASGFVEISIHTCTPPREKT